MEDYDLRAQQSASFKNVPNAHYFEIHTDQNISIKFNSTDMPAIALDVFDSPHVFNNMLNINSAFLTNVSGNTANIKVLAV